MYSSVLFIQLLFDTCFMAITVFNASTVRTEFTKMFKQLKLHYKNIFF